MVIGKVVPKSKRIVPWINQTTKEFEKQKRNEFRALVKAYNTMSIASAIHPNHEVRAYFRGIQPLLRTLGNELGVKLPKV